MLRTSVLILIGLMMTSSVSAVGALPPGPPPEQIRTELDRECQAGAPQACLDLGHALEKLRWDAGQQAAVQANQAFEQACQLGSCQGCLAASDHEAASHVCIAPCESGDRHACFGLMGIHSYEKATDSSPAEAQAWADRYLALARAQCDRGDPIACHDLGVAVAIGFPAVPVDRDAARMAFSQATSILQERCRADHVNSCSLLVAQREFRAITQTQGTRTDLTHACRTLRADCAAGNWSSCALLEKEACTPLP